MAENSRESLVVALGALLLEMAHVDGAVDDGEAQTVRAILQRRVGDQSQALLERAEALREESEDLADLAGRLAPRLTLAQRLDVVGMLWEVAFADGSVDRMEDFLTNRVATVFELHPTSVAERRTRAEARKSASTDEQGG